MKKTHTHTQHTNTHTLYSPRWISLLLAQQWDPSDQKNADHSALPLHSEPWLSACLQRLTNVSLIWKEGVPWSWRFCWSSGGLGSPRFTDGQGERLELGFGDEGLSVMKKLLLAYSRVKQMGTLALKWNSCQGWSVPEGCRHSAVKQACKKHLLCMPYEH